MSLAVPQARSEDIPVGEAPLRGSRRAVGALTAALAIAWLLGATGCRREDRDSLEIARESLRDALARRDVTALSDARALLRNAHAETPEEFAEIAGLMMSAGETAHALWLLEAGVSRHPDRDELRILLARAALVVGDPIRVLAVLESVEPRSERHLEALLLRARAQLELGNLDAALATFEEAQERYPDSPHASYARVSALLREGRVEDARAVIEEARRRAPSPERLRELDALVAQIEFAHGEREAGLDRLRSLVERDPDDIATRQLFTRYLQADGRLAESLEVARAGLARSPEHPALQALVAGAYALLGRREEAEEALGALVEQNDSPDARLLLARYQLLTDRPAAAAAALSEGAQRFPDAAMLRMHEAEAWLDAGDVARARVAKAEFQRRAPEDPHLGYLAARIALAEGDARRAASELGQVVSKLDRAYTQYWLGRALEETGDHFGARRRYALALARDRRHPAPAIALMRLAEQRSDWRAASEYAAQLVARLPAAHEGYANLVTFLARSGDGARAEAAARLYAQRFPESKDAPVLLAMSLRVQGRHSEAEAALDAAEADHGPAPEFDHERALIHGALGDTAAGIRAVRSAIQGDPDEPRYQATLAALAFAMGDVESGDRAVETALASDPTFLEPLKLRATYRAASRDFEGAREDIERYLAARPLDAELYFMRGVVAEKQGRDADAAADYRRAIELDEAGFAPYNNLAMLLAEAGEIEEALRMANRAYARASSNPQVVGTLGWVYHRAGLATRAVKLLERARELDPGSAETQRQLALARKALEREGDRTAPAEDPSVEGYHQGAARPSESGSRKPNIALIVVDTLRPDWTTPYGDPRGTSPELARWAQHGVVFERVSAQSSWTKVSVASLMTSLWPADHGVREVRDALGDEAETLAEHFQRAGYATYGVQSNGWLAATFGFQQGFDRYVFPRGAKVPWMKSMVWPHADNVYLEAERLLAAHDPATPFFLYLHFMDVHEYAAPSEFQQFGTDSAGAYRAAIRWVDHVLERLRARLQELGQLDDTVLVLASDHGETFGEDRRFGHARNALLPVLRVPLVIRLPRATAPLRIHERVRNLDLAPTLLDLAGIPVPQSFQGESLVPLMSARGESSGRDRTSYASLPAVLFRDAVRQESVSSGGWGFARDLEAPHREQLFDLLVDPDEEVNLVEIEAEMATRMRALLDAYQAHTPLPGAVRADVRIDPQIADKLRALGYLQ